MYTKTPPSPPKKNLSIKMSIQCPMCTVWYKYRIEGRDSPCMIALSQLSLVAYARLAEFDSCTSRTFNEHLDKVCTHTHTHTHAHTHTHTKEARTVMLYSHPKYVRCYHGNALFAIVKIYALHINIIRWTSLPNFMKTDQKLMEEFATQALYHFCP